MYYITFYYEKGKLNATSEFLSKGKKTKRISLTDEAIEDFIKALNEEESKIKSVKFDGNDLNFNLENFKVKLVNKKRFRVDDRFDFVFDHIKKKSYKLNKKALSKGAIALTSALIITLTPVGIKKYIKNNSVPTSNTTGYSQITDFSTMNSLENILASTTSNNSYNVSNKKETTTIKTSNIKKEVTEKKETTTTKKATNKIEYGTLSDSDKARKTKELYGDIISKYSQIYGVDSDVMCAIATQERGIHSDRVDDGGAIGLMQIQVSVWAHETLKAYNNELGRKEEIYVTLDNLRDVSFNIKVACAIFQNCLKKMDGNYLAAIQCYNMGEGTMGKILRTYCNNNGKSMDEVLKNENDLGWMKYREGYSGDSAYLEHVMRYYDGESIEVSKVR